MSTTLKQGQACEQATTFLYESDFSAHVTDELATDPNYDIPETPYQVYFPAHNHLMMIKFAKVQPDNFSHVLAAHTPLEVAYIHALTGHIIHRRSLVFDQPVELHFAASAIFPGWHYLLRWSED